jgi:hypothetical protein
MQALDGEYVFGGACFFACLVDPKAAVVCGCSRLFRFDEFVWASMVLISDMRNESERE